MSRARIFRGIGASPGVALGRVFILDRRSVRVRRYHVRPDQIDYEIDRLQTAINKSVEQLESIRGNFVGDGHDHQSILEAHGMMLRDHALFAEATDLIRNDLLNAEWAIRRVISRLRALFDKVSDSYFKERRGDIDFVGDRILRNLVGQVADIADIDMLDDGTVVVAHDLSPVDAALLSRQRVTAFVTEIGGKTSHTSIVARSLEVPAVVGVKGILDSAGSGDGIVVDGLDGTVMLRPSRAQLDRGRIRSDLYHQASLEMLEAKALPARTLDGYDVTVAGNIELPTEITNVLNRGGEAIGLYRTEFLFLGRSIPPGEEDHYRTYCHLFDEVGGRQVTVRTLDLGGEKIFGPMVAELEPNPALGLRAIRYCLRNPEVFEAQISGLLRAAVHGNLRIMLPMISCITEFRQALAFIDEVKEKLQRDGREFDHDVPVGIMIEVPSAVMTADILAREAAFFSIGTNDLLQYLLAIDRTNERVNYLYNPLQPAVLRTLRMITEAAANAKIPVSVCGEMAGQVTHVPIFLALGIQQLSMNAGSIPRLKRMVRELRRDECQALLLDALQCETFTEVGDMVRQFVHAKTSFTSSMLRQDSQ
ncbi:MAG: phosphoenolpyruvate--protein phosphotransferase [Deltaproteobacteria bacterium RIFOXYA12_FULL_58_15]|nr:MAG: phosphoenolpyruvate--protein phosphotransferase [Deltaproteobacteria bacterium RIFOXYA12_FULL_58_15]OGR08345.1 MAG: phosphoenolpyruvate--protein phosphotransferase [Deltaproteobacteria bacterium RIFOXYB12_FULL_58_9]